MDIATEEFSHLEIVGSAIQMLLTGVNGELKDAADQEEIMSLLDGPANQADMELSKIMLTGYRPYNILLSAFSYLNSDKVNSDYLN